MSVMPLNMKQEQLSIAYVRAIASIAGFTVDPRNPDIDSVDLEICAPGFQGTHAASPQVGVQLKSTRQPIGNGNSFRFPLSKKNYDELRRRTTVPRILVVVAVPNLIDKWLTHSEEQLVVRHCGYWRALYGLPDSPNTTSVSVEVDRSRKFDVPGLEALMQLIADGGLT